MHYPILEYVIAQLKRTRLKKKISQKELGRRVGMPQSHISKIEKGDVDLQASTLLELARNLEMEVLLVPRRLVPVVRGLMREEAGEKLAQTPRYQLRGDDDD